MRYNTYINNVKCLEWGISATQGALVDLLNQVHTWAKAVVIDGDVFYFIARQAVIKELPLYYSKLDTVYRHFKVLEDKGILVYLKDGKRDLIKLTNKGKMWNSDLNPNKLGFESENNSDLNPTYNTTILDNNTKGKDADIHPLTPTEKLTIKRIGKVQFDLLKENRDYFTGLDAAKRSLLVDWLEHRKRLKHECKNFQTLKGQANGFFRYTTNEITDAIEIALSGGKEGWRDIRFAFKRIDERSVKNGRGKSVETVVFKPLKYENA